MKFEHFHSSLGRISYRKGFHGNCATSCPKSTPLVVFVHGFANCSVMWNYVLNELLSTKPELGQFHYIAYDNVGHGYSGFLHPELEYTNDKFTQILNELLLELYPLASTVYLVGHSQGALISAHYALRRSDIIKGLVLVTPAGISFKISDFFWNPMHLLARGLYVTGTQKSIQMAAIRMSYWIIYVLSYFTWIHPLLHLLFETFSFLKLSDKDRTQYFNMLANMLDHCDLLVNRHDLYRKVVDAGIDVRLVFGTLDPLVTATAAKRLTQHLYGREDKAAYITASHTIPLENPQAVVHAIKSILQTQ